MVVSIEFSGMFRHVTSTHVINIPIDHDTKVTDALDYLTRQFPALKINKNTAIITVNHEVVALDRLLNPDDRISILPPIGGG